MHTLHIGGNLVGYVDDLGSVKRPAGAAVTTVGSMRADGAAERPDGSLAGTVDTSGSIFDGAGTFIGHVDGSGSVIVGGQVVGTVSGNNPLAGAAALLLLPECPKPAKAFQGMYDTGPDLDQQGYVLAAIIGVLPAYLGSVANANANLVWLAMLGTSCLTVLRLAWTFSRDLPAADLPSIRLKHRMSSRGIITSVAEESLEPFVRLYPVLLFALIPALLVAGLVTSLTLPLEHPPFIYVSWLMSVCGGLLLSLSVMPFLLRKRLDSLLQARLLAQAHEGLIDTLIEESALSNPNHKPYGGIAAIACLVLSFGIFALRTNPAALASLIRSARLWRITARPSYAYQPRTLPALKRSSYSGHTGRKAARFDLDWSERDQAVVGSYYTLDRPGRKYRLIGSNPVQGKLTLKEFTGTDFTASIYLSKSVSGRQVSWSGTMVNSDGRRIPVRMYRTSGN